MLVLRGEGKSWRAFQNIGGIGNVTFVPAKGYAYLLPFIS